MGYAMTMSHVKHLILFCAAALSAGCTYVRLATATPVIRHDAAQGVYRLEGVITFNTASQLAKQVPAGSTLYVTSPGGRSEVAPKIVDWANANRIRLVIKGSCMSACANTLAAARDATFEAPLALLFHGAGPDDDFYLRNGRNPAFVRFAHRATLYVHEHRAGADGRRKLPGVAVPYFWVPTSSELKCFGVAADVTPLADFKPAAKASGMYFTTDQLPQALQDELANVCRQWEQTATRL